jgi:uncharacterized protein (TIRG00374 family)
MNRRLLAAGLKVAVVTFAVIWLSRRVEWLSVLRVISAASPAQLLLAYGLSWVPICISAFRWRALLRVLDIPVSLGQLLRVAQIGQFFAVLVPGVAGDDGTRFYYISRFAPGRARQACSTVLLDRVLGFGSLFVVSLFCIPLNWSLMEQTPGTRLIGFVFLAVGGLMLVSGAVFFAVPKAKLDAVIRAVQARFESSRLVADLTGAAMVFSGRRAVLAGVVFGALLTQLVLSASFWAGGEAVGISLNLLSWASFVPVILVAAVLPITFAGIGVRDTLLFLFLGGVARSDPERVAALSILMLAFGLTTASLGGVVYLFFKPPSPQEGVVSP